MYRRVFSLDPSPHCYTELGLNPFNFFPIIKLAQPLVIIFIIIILKNTSLKKELGIGFM